MCRTWWTAPVWNRTCSSCHADLLQGETASFCCNKGKWITPELPPLPASLMSTLEWGAASRHVSARSWALNNLFAFTAIGATQHFQHFDAGPSSVAITGRTYHRIFDISDSTHSLHWFLYDGSEQQAQGKTFNVPYQWTSALDSALQEINPYVHQLRRFSTLPTEASSALELSDVSANGDFAAVLHAANSTAVDPRAIVIWHNHNSEPSFIPIFSRHYEPLQYPLLFPHSSPGWGLKEGNNSHLTNCVPLTQREWYRSRLLSDTHFLTFGQLSCEYLCDMYFRIEEERLKFIRRSKETYNADVLNKETVDDSENLKLPCSFMGSRKWVSEQTADSLALARTYGPPSFFITMTCNPNWPEIKSQLRPGQHAYDAPVIVARAFKLRLQRLLHLLKTKMGTVTYMTTSNEFQKRGFPHSHIVMQVHPCSCVMKDRPLTCHKGLSGTARSRHQPNHQSGNPIR